MYTPYDLLRYYVQDFLKESINLNKKELDRGAFTESVKHRLSEKVSGQQSKTVRERESESESE
jgi:hypothetical protein